MSFSLLKNIYDFCIRFLLIFLPWSTLISVFFTYKLFIPGSSFIKEGVFFLAGAVLLLLYIKIWKAEKKFPIHWTFLDILIGAYIFYMVLITLFTTGISGLAFGGRYDIGFLLVYMIAFHGYRFLQKSFSYYLLLFLASAGLMLLVSGILKYPLHEELLLYLGYSPSISAWNIGDAPPIFHGIDGANIRRFQGLLDGPNTMGAFLILVSGIFLYWIRYKKDWHFVAGCICIGFFIMLLYTYSRSALISAIFGIIVASLWSLKFLYKKYKMQILTLGCVILLIGSVIFIKFSGMSNALIGREGSTKGHSERMKIGIERCIEVPLGQGLGSAGPAYRHVMKLSGQSREEVEEIDRYYIPESWYIQQFIEGGFVGGILFLLIMANIFFSLLFLHPILGGMFAGIGAMNLFLHTFESSTLAFSLFILIGLLLSYAKNKK